MNVHIAILRSAALGVAAMSLAGCQTLQRISEVGAAPPTSAIVNPTQTPQYRPVSMPMPQPQMPTGAINSLWRPGARAFFKDQRASEVGDILTVKVEFSEQETQFQARTDTSRENQEQSQSGNTFLGYETSLGRIFPEAINPAARLWDLGSNNKVYGDGTTYRKDKFSAVMAATITQVLPNGNMVIMGRQELRVNNELRELTVQGIIRSSDIDGNNSITYDKIAEARVALGGRGNVSDVTRARWGQEIFDLVFPF